MATFKCKMCGGTLEVQPGESVAVCDSCGRGFFAASPRLAPHIAIEKRKPRDQPVFIVIQQTDLHQTFAAIEHSDVKRGFFRRMGDIHEGDP